MGIEDVVRVYVKEAKNETKSIPPSYRKIKVLKAIINGFRIGAKAEEFSLEKIDPELKPVYQNWYKKGITLDLRENRIGFDIFVDEMNILKIPSYKACIKNIDVDVVSRIDKHAGKFFDVLSGTPGNERKDAVEIYKEGVRKGFNNESLASTQEKYFDWLKLGHSAGQELFILQKLNMVKEPTNMEILFYKISPTEIKLRKQDRRKSLN